MARNKPGKNGGKVQNLQPHGEFKHSHSSVEYRIDGKYKSKLFLNDIEKVVYDLSQSKKVMLAKEEKDDYFRSKFVESKEIDEESKQLLLKKLSTRQMIPRKVAYSSEISADAYKSLELQAFKDWKDQLESIKNTDAQIRITFYEYNLEVWRQFWMVIERSNIICEIVDCRSPLNFICKDIREICQQHAKHHILVLNKCDLLTKKQKELWKNFFDGQHTKVIFWSNRDESKNFTSFIEEIHNITSSGDVGHELDNNNINQHLNIGFVGYPNVGKSSTINFLTKAKRVAESSTPGKTKICQTIVVSDNCSVFDCPGLFIPKYFTDESEIALMGIYPVDQITQPGTVIKKIVERIPVKEMMKFLNLKSLVKESADDTENIVLNYGRKIKMLIGSERVDSARVCKKMIKQYIDGKILYCHPPPGQDPVKFNEYDDSPVEALSNVEMLLGAQSQLINKKVKRQHGASRKNKDNTPVNRFKFVPNEF